MFTGEDLTKLERETATREELYKAILDKNIHEESLDKNIHEESFTHHVDQIYGPHLPSSLKLDSTSS